MTYKDPDRQREYQREWIRHKNGQTPEAARAYRLIAKERNQRYIRELKTDTPCTDCGEFYPYVVMDFDHVRGVKKMAVSRMASTRCSLATLQAEIAKCEIVCANCHRIRTWKRTGEEPLDS